MTPGMVTNIQRYSVNDGYGIRTIVFLSGCSLSCFWCQNPETLGDGKPVVMFIEDSCAGCGACIGVCPNGAVALSPEGIVFDRGRCKACFKCVGQCYFGARKVSATSMTVDQALYEVMKDESFYRNSNGGVTLSGGEPLVQPEFCQELLRLVKQAGIHTAVETAGNIPRSTLENIVPQVDLFLYDIKAMDENVHKAATGVSNQTILDNLLFLTQSGVEIILRVPLIPGINDGREFNAIADFAAGSGLNELHLLPYHTVGMSKYQQLGLPYPGEKVPEGNTSEVERCEAYAAAKGLRVSIGGGGFARQNNLPAR